MRLLTISGILAVLIGLAFVFPQIASWREEAEVKVGLLVLGCAVVLAGLGFLFRGLTAERVKS